MSAQEHQANLLTKYEEARKEILSYCELHQADIPRAKSVCRHEAEAICTT